MPHIQNQAQIPSQGARRLSALNHFHRDPGAWRAFGADNTGGGVTFRVTLPAADL